MLHRYRYKASLRSGYFKDGQAGLIADRHVIAALYGRTIKCFMKATWINTASSLQIHAGWLKSTGRGHWWDIWAIIWLHYWHIFHDDIPGTHKADARNLRYWMTLGHYFEAYRAAMILRHATYDESISADWYGYLGTPLVSARSHISKYTTLQFYFTLRRFKYFIMMTCLSLPPFAFRIGHSAPHAAWYRWHEEHYFYFVKQRDFTMIFSLFRFHARWPMALRDYSRCLIWRAFTNMKLTISRLHNAETHLSTTSRYH